MLNQDLLTLPKTQPPQTKRSYITFTSCFHHRPHLPQTPTVDARQNTACQLSSHTRTYSRHHPLRYCQSVASSLHSSSSLIHYSPLTTPIHLHTHKPNTRSWTVRCARCYFLRSSCSNLTLKHLSSSFVGNSQTLAKKNSTPIKHLTKDLISPQSPEG